MYASTIIMIHKFLSIQNIRSAKENTIEQNFELEKPKKRSNYKFKDIQNIYTRINIRPGKKSNRQQSHETKIQGAWRKIG